MKHRLSERIKNFNITILITLFLLFSCGSGQQAVGAGKTGTAGGDKQGTGRLSEVISSARQLFLDAFVSFGNLLKGVLGLTVDTTKKEVGEQLGRLGEAVQVVKDKLEGLKGNEQFNLIKDKADSVITKAIGILKKIVEGASKIKDATKDADDGKIASATGDTEDANPANPDSVKNLIAGISMIYEAAKGAGTELRGDSKKPIADSKDIAKLFNQTANANDSKALNEAGRAVSAANGADILAAIEAVKDKSNQAGNIQDAKNTYDIAIATKSNDDITGDVQTNASAIAAGLALRAMAKDGKLAINANNAPKDGINVVLIGVVGKTVNEIVSIVRRTVDKCLKDIDIA